MNSSSNVVNTHYSGVGGSSGLRVAGASIINSSLSQHGGGGGGHGALIVPHVKLHQLKGNSPHIMDDSLISNPYSTRDPNGNVSVSCRMIMFL
jgi:hypothetical protein